MSTIGDPFPMKLNEMYSGQINRFVWIHGKNSNNVPEKFNVERGLGVNHESRRIASKQKRDNYKVRRSSLKSDQI